MIRNRAVANWHAAKKNIQQPHYTNPLFALIYFANKTLSRISINTIATSISILGIKFTHKPIAITITVA